jgi:arginyl-tRNA synthetase
MTPPLEDFEVLCKRILQVATEKTYPGKGSLVTALQPPPNIEFGELASSVAFQIAQEIGGDPRKVADSISSAIEFDPSGLLRSVEVAGGGYVNFRLNYAAFTPLVLEEINGTDRGYGFIKSDHPLRVVVEHTSANPNGPLHLGHVRNTILGDSLARLQKNRGHEVKRRFYIDDTGKQVAILAFGYQLLGKPKPTGKIDHWFGLLYACTNCAIEIQERTTKLHAFPVEESSNEEYQRLRRELDEWVAVAQELRSPDSKLFDAIVDALKTIPDPTKRIEKLVQEYESQSPDAVRLVRQVCEACLSGIRETLAKVGVEFDIWDWESEVVWSNEVDEILGRLAATKYVAKDGLSMKLDSIAIVEVLTSRKELDLTQSFEIPSMTLTRSDGTSLYATRDIAYTLRKFRDADRVINVIGTEQKLPQLQIKLALNALGMRELAHNLVHYSYGLVEIEGLKMSRRRGRFISFDELIDQAIQRASAKTSKRDEQISATEATEITTTIAHAAIRYSMVNVSSSKTIMFSWDRVLSLERNSAPFVNYAYTRARAILQKVGPSPTNIDLTLLQHPEEKWLIHKLGSFPLVFADAADNLRPEELAIFASALAEKFHEYYEKFPVLRAENEKVKHARAQLVRAVATVLRNCMETLGIPLTEKM